MVSETIKRKEEIKMKDRVEMELARYEAEYEKAMERQECLEACIEEEIAEVVGNMEEDKEWEGKECECCGHPIRINGHIRGEYDAWDHKIRYTFWCDDCYR